ncbi:MAG: sialate O-acetylesterase [Phycisphaeraceae bacterium]
MARFIPRSIARCLPVSCCVAAVCCAAPATAQPVKVYLMAGQSNMEGWGRWYENDGVTQHATLVDPTDNYPLTQAEADAYTVPLNRVWVAHPGTNRKATGPLEPGFGAAPSNGVNIGIELSMGHELAANNANDFFFYKSDRGGTSLASNWRPPSAAAQRGGSVGAEYRAMIRGFHDLLEGFDSNPLNNGEGFEVAGFVWLQGWNDYNTTSAGEYEQNVLDLARDVRRDLGIADLPIILSDAPRDVSVPLHNAVATAKANAVNTLNSALPGSAVYVDSLGVDPDGGGGWFHWNFTASNYIEMGKRNAAAAQSVMRSTPINHEGDAGVAAAWDRFRDENARIVRYAMEEGPGTTIFNTGMNAVADALLTDAAARTGGLGGSAGAIDADVGVIRATNDFGNINQTYTLGAWVNLDQLADAQGRFAILSTEDNDGSGSDTGWNFGIERKQVGGEWLNYLYFDLRNRNDMDSLNDSNDGTDLVLESDREYFVAFVRDVTIGSSNKDNTLFYLYDALTGELVVSNGGSSETQKATTFKNIRVGIGVDGYNAEQPGTRFQGLIDDAQIWDLALGEADIFTLAQNGSLFGQATLPGDTDNDGDIDDSDLGTAFSNYTGPLAPGTGGKTAADGDTDGDGDVDDSDLGTAFAGYTGPLGPTAGQTVPEPAGLALIGLGGLALARRRRG